MKVCFWTTTFQADIQAAACHLAQRDDVQVLVAATDPERYRSQAIERFLPFRGEMVARDTTRALWRLWRFAPDVLVVDNHLPTYRPKRMYVLWHGYGWRVDHPERMRKNMARRVGPVTAPNPRFRWQAVGPLDREFTAGHRGIHPDNILTLGSPCSDLLRPESPLTAAVRPELVQDAYPGIDIVNRPTVLIGMTWHHGGLLGHWGDEWDLLGRLLDRIASLGANTILRMHDRMRYDRAYLEEMERFCARRDGVVLKFKCESPDSLVDILISDVLITNYSSFANLYYFTGKPTVHIVPPEAGAGLRMRQWSKSGLSDEVVDRPEAFWKLSPADVGGLRAFAFDDLLAKVETAMVQPDCCATQAADFVSRHVVDVDGLACDRFEGALRRWIAS